MSITNILIMMTAFALIITIIASGVAIFVFYKNRRYLQKLLEYNDGLTNIQSRLKDMFLEHHTLMDQAIIENSQKILDSTTRILRWQKVTARMVRVGDQKPMKNATAIADPLKEAEQLHDLGLEIADVAFKDKQELTEDENGKEKPLESS